VHPILFLATLSTTYPAILHASPSFSAQHHFRIYRSSTWLNRPTTQSPLHCNQLTRFQSQFVDKEVKIVFLLQDCIEIKGAEPFGKLCLTQQGWFTKLFKA
jgi:hypothetical protein